MGGEFVNVCHNSGCCLKHKSFHSLCFSINKLRVHSLNIAWPTCQSSYLCQYLSGQSVQQHSIKTSSCTSTVKSASRQAAVDTACTWQSHSRTNRLRSHHSASTTHDVLLVSKLHAPNRVYLADAVESTLPVRPTHAATPAVLFPKPSHVLQQIAGTFGRDGIPYGRLRKAAVA